MEAYKRLKVELHSFMEVSGAASSHRLLYREGNARCTHWVGRFGGGNYGLSFLGIEPRLQFVQPAA
jgi:hypothetical protein